MPTDAAFKEVTERLIHLVKVFLGWHPSDLTGITTTFGLKESQGGMHIRFFGAKTNKNKWSGWVFVPRFSSKYIHLCIVTTIELVRNMAAGMQATQIEVRDLQNKPAFDFPLFVYKKEGVLYPLANTTISNKTKVLMQEMFKGESTYTPHSFRHAVASQLADMGVVKKAVAEHLQIDEATVAKTYTVPVERSYALPQKCVEKAKHLVHKVLVPWLHSKDSTVEFF